MLCLQGPVKVYDPVFTSLDKSVLESYDFQV